MRLVRSVEPSLTTMTSMAAPLNSNTLERHSAIDPSPLWTLTTTDRTTGKITTRLQHTFKRERFRRKIDQFDRLESNRIDGVEVLQGRASSLAYKHKMAQTNLSLIKFAQTPAAIRIRTSSDGSTNRIDA